MSKTPKIIRELFALAGVTINGPNPWDIQVHHSRTYDLILSKWSLGLGESYMYGYWDCLQLDNFLYRLLKYDLNMNVRGYARVRLVSEVIRAKALNLQSRAKSFEVAEQHYDIGNDVFEKMLGPQMIYSCGYWEGADNLIQSQNNKLEMICRKLQLKPGETLLDIGCGWGGLAAYAATHYGVEVLGVTVSKEQQQWAQQHFAGLPIKIELTDYRTVRGQFDKIVSVGMFEHVGEKNYNAYFNTVKNALKDDGLFLLHTIGSDVAIARTDPWIDRYIFPNGKIPSASQLSKALEGVFLIEDWHNFGNDYDKTLMAWHDNFITHWDELSHRYSPRFYRMWRYYLLSCAAYFRARQGQLWQLVLSKRGRQETYRSIRLGATNR
jgi:cyclopropane-fatty-acyl-phospholipid synthase